MQGLKFPERGAAYVQYEWLFHRQAPCRMMYFFYGGSLRHLKDTMRVITLSSTGIGCDITLDTSGSTGSDRDMCYDEMESSETSEDVAVLNLSFWRVCWKRRRRRRARRW